MGTEHRGIEQGGTEAPRAVLLACSGAFPEQAWGGARSAGYAVVALMGCAATSPTAAVLAELLQVASDLQADAAVVVEGGKVPMHITTCSFRAAAAPP